MTNEDVIARINRCLKKADMEEFYKASTDPDEDVEFVFDEDGFLILFICHPRIHTPFRSEDFQRIVWGRNRDRGTNYIALLFDNDDYLTIEEDGYTELQYNNKYYGTDLKILQEEYKKLRQS